MNVFVGGTQDLSGLWNRNREHPCLRKYSCIKLWFGLFYMSMEGTRGLTANNLMLLVNISVIKVSHISLFFHSSLRVSVEFTSLLGILLQTFPFFHDQMLTGWFPTCVALSLQSNKPHRVLATKQVRRVQSFVHPDVSQAASWSD